jgi:hypothetical protein
MIKIIDDGKIMNCEEARRLYRTYRIVFFVTERNLTRPMEDEGYVYAICDDDDEWSGLKRTFDSSIYEGRDPVVIVSSWTFGFDYDLYKSGIPNRIVSAEKVDDPDEIARLLKEYGTW